MRLESIKLSGFKSFVEPTVVRLPGQLAAVVGPNGCGKSNIIDAVRWVMGESSAKQLRGEQMTDVIFNGSANRKPLGLASIELTFNNSDGRLAGEFSKYQEVMVRREVSRDGQSSYYLNGSRCRRRDVADLFLGTGLGPRSYAIIRQDSISRLVEAKPDELRVYLEEAAGVSRYKERRDETENRIQHTRDNLARLEDIRGELHKQIQHLERQAKAAEKFKNYKAEERLLRAQTQVMQWQQLSKEALVLDEALAQQTQQFLLIQEKQQQTHEKLGADRQQLHSQKHTLDNQQASFYQLKNEITRLQEQSTYQQQRHGELTAANAQAESEQQILMTEQKNLQCQLLQLQQTLSEVHPQWDGLQQQKIQQDVQVQEATDLLKEWQQAWEQFQKQMATHQQQAQVNKVQLQHLEQQLQDNLRREQQLQQELQALEMTPQKKRLDDLQGILAEAISNNDDAKAMLQQTIQAQEQHKQQQQQWRATADAQQREWQQLQAKQTSLEALQAVALGKQEGESEQWLVLHHLQQAKRLAEHIQVTEGFEFAVETVLAEALQAIAVDNVDDYLSSLQTLSKGQLFLFQEVIEDTTEDGRKDLIALTEKIETIPAIRALLQSIYVVEDVAEAQSKKHLLKAHESFITREGLWIGRHWLRIRRVNEKQSGVIVRAQTIKALATQINSAMEAIESTQQQLDAVRSHLQQLDELREQQQREVLLTGQKRSEVQAEINSLKNEMTKSEQRLQRLLQEQQELAQRKQQFETKQAETRLVLEQVELALQQQETERAHRLQAGEDKKILLQEQQSCFQSLTNRVHEMRLQVELLQSQIHHAEQQSVRLAQQLAQLQQKQGQISEEINQIISPQQEINARLQSLLSQEQTQAQQLSQLQESVKTLEQAVVILEQEKNNLEQQAQSLQNDMQKIQLDKQTIIVRSQTIDEYFAESTVTREEALQALPENILLNELQEKLQQLEQRIQRLGAINLAAIEEYSEVALRKDYLDTQCADLESALTTLESAIRKIDQETKIRFQDTFAQVNHDFSQLFPRVFAGGEAFLELTGDDILTSGVIVRARPPGKRNSTIHALSGGEKALTALALVFAIFQLNPAPFCMLDEVDAPLDDSNVMRFCQLVKTMSEKVQFVFITHNKVTMEMADYLLGITMQEPGVSRLVSVNVEEAMALAEI